MLLLTFCQLLSLAGIAADKHYGGVEIGSKGVKRTHLIVKDGNAGSEFKEEKTRDVGLVAGGFDAKVIDDAAAAVVESIAKLREKNVPEDQIYVVASSGVVGKATVEQRSALVAAVKTRSSKDLTLLSVEDEVRLLFHGVVPPEDKARAWVIDIGSGNTKFGAYSATGKFEVGELKSGLGDQTTKFSDLIKSGTAIDAALDTIRADFQKRLGPEVQLFQQKVGVKPQVIYVAGGTFWSMLAYEQPVDSGKVDVVVRPESVKSFQSRVRSETPQVIDLSGLTPDKAQTDATSVLKSVNNAISLDSLRTASALLDAAFETFALKDSSAAIKFDRNAVFAWIRGFVREKAIGRVVSTKRYGGIEIGSKSVKRTILIVTDGEEPTEKEEKTRDVGLVAGGFEESIIQEAATAVAESIRLLIDKDVPESQIYVVASSGVAGRASPEQLESLRSAVKTKTRKEVDVLRVQDEVRLVFAGIVPEKDQPNALLIDIGSGNTKFGAMTPKGIFEVGELKSGLGDRTASFVEYTKKGQVRTDALDAVQKDFFAQLNPEATRFRRLLVAPPKVVYLVGGAPWAMLAYQQPTNSGPDVKILPGSFDAFHLRARDDSPEAIDEATLDPDARGVLKSVRNNISGDSLRTASALIDGVVASFELKDPTLDVRFHRSAAFAWIRGYVYEKVIGRRASPPAPEDPVLKALTSQLTAVQTQVGGLSDGQRKLGDTVQDLATKQDALTLGLNGLKSSIESLVTQLKDAPKPQPVNLQPLEGSLNQIGSTLKRIESKIDSLGSISPSVTYDPVEARKAFELGRSYYWKCQFEEALPLFIQASEFDNEPIYHFYRALTESKLKRDNDAELSVRRVALSLRAGRGTYEGLCRLAEREQGPSRSFVDRTLRRAIWDAQRLN